MGMRLIHRCAIFQFLVLIAVFSSGLFVDGLGKVEEKTICTNTFAGLDCDDHRIHILEVFSGKSRLRNHLQGCKARPSDETLNTSIAARSIWKECNLRPNCHVYMDDGHYYTYVFIRYQCIQEIPAFDVCSNITSPSLTAGHLFSPGYPLIIPAKHATRCSCHATSNTPVYLTMNIKAEQFRCPDKQRLNVFSDNRTRESSYVCESFNHAPLYVKNKTDIAFEFLNYYYAAGGKFWIKFRANKPITLTCGSGSETTKFMSTLANVSRISVKDVTQTLPSTTEISPTAKAPSSTQQIIPEVHIYHRVDGKSPNLKLVIDIMIVSTVMLTITITLYICWQHRIRKRNSSSSPSSRHQEQQVTVSRDDYNKIIA